MPRTINTAAQTRIVAFVTARTPHGTGVDIHADAFEIALVASPGGVLGTAPGDWRSAVCDPTPVFTDKAGVSTYAVTLTVAPGGYVAGEYTAFVRPHDNPDVEVLPFDTVTFVAT